MASEYLKWKYRDVAPAEQIALTKREKRKNWWHYHKWHVIIGAVLLCAAADILCHALGIGEIRPDYRIAYVGSAYLPDETATALEAALSELGEDANGDGRTTVELRQYVSGAAGDSDAAYYAMAASAKLMADITGRESYFFLLEDPEGFQMDYHALRRLDGTLPTDVDRDWQRCCVRWADCPALAGLELGTYEETLLTQRNAGDNQALLENLYFARRGFWTEKTSDNVEACDALWNALTKGTLP